MVKIMFPSTLVHSQAFAWILFISMTQCLSQKNFRKTRAVNLTHKCGFTPGMVFEDRYGQLECCDHFTGFMTREYNPGYAVYLDTMKEWNCPQFEHECEYPSFSRYSDYTEHVYKMFCDTKAYMESCGGIIANISGQATADYHLITQDVWKNMLISIDLHNLNRSELLNPCVQTAMYSNTSANDGLFTELQLGFLPFCDSIFTGFDDRLLQNPDFMLWSIMNDR